VNNDKLVERLLPDFPDPKVRRLFVTPEISDLLDGRIHAGALSPSEVDGLITRFRAGLLVRVSRKKAQRKRNHPELEWLDGFDQIWVMCFRRLRPGLRILGRFYEKDHLVLLRHYDKRVLVKKYLEAEREVIDDWEKLFGTRAAHSGTDFGDYMSGSVRDIDEAI